MKRENKGNNDIRSEAGESAARRPRGSYDGGKAGSGVYQSIINLMPPHDAYIEAFLGGGAIMRTKRLAEYSIGIESDEGVIKTLWRPREWPDKGFHVIKADAVEWLRSLNLDRYKDRRTTLLIYADPPYLMSVRSCKQPMYKHEFHSEAQHAKLLDVLLSLPCMVMISGYDSDLYNRKLAGWRKVQFTGISRRGPTIETVWMNFPEPAELHDYRFLGADRRERQDLKRQKKRWISRLAKMPPQKRYAMLAAIEEYKETFLTGGEAAAQSTADY